MNFFDKYLHIVATPPPSNLLYEGQHSVGFVLLSVGIAIFASYIALLVADFAERAEKLSTKNLLLTLGGLALGVGIWSMHFVGMLGFTLSCHVGYSPWITAFSMLPGILASMLSLHLISRHEMDLKTLLTGGTLFGAGIGVMHYAGMAAMNMNALLRYDLKLFLLSILVAVILAILALWIRSGIAKIFHRSSQFALLPTAIVMGGAVSGMHYTAMRAAYFLRGAPEVETQTGFDPLMMAIIIASVTFLLIGLVLIFTFQQILQDMDSVKMASQQAQERSRLDNIEMTLQNWIKQSLADIDNALLGADTFCKFADALSSEVAAKLDLIYGALYVFDAKNQELKRAGGFCCDDNLHQSHFKIGQGLVGQAAKDHKNITLAFPQNSIAGVSVGVGIININHALILPITHNGELLGVFELGSLYPIDVQKSKFLDTLLRSVAAKMQILSGNIMTKKLLNEALQHKKQTVNDEE